MDRIDSRPVYNPDDAVEDGFSGERGIPREWRDRVRAFHQPVPPDDWKLAFPQARLRENEAEEEVE